MNILLADSDTENLEKNVWKCKKMPFGGLQIVPKNAKKIFLIT